MITLITLSSILLVALIAWIYDSINRAIRISYAKGWDAALKRNDPLNYLRQQAVARGKAKWVVVNDFTGQTEFRWIA